MFNLQGSELIIILLLALVVLGPEKLPEAMRKAGQFYAELKRMSSGFQQEFRAVVDEPMREVRDTANMLRDSADFRSLQTGEREEKPKSAEMVAAPDPDATPVDDVPTFDGAESDTQPDDEAAAPADDVVERPDDRGTAEQSSPRLDPFANSAHSSAAPRVEDPVPKPFSADQSSSAAPRVEADSEADGRGDGAPQRDADVDDGDEAPSDEESTG